MAEPIADAGPWAGRRVLVTGHTGFKGGWLCLWLARMGAHVTGIALPAPTEPSLFSATGLAGLIDSRVADIRDADALRQAAGGIDAEIVFHLAAQPIVRASYATPAETFATNVTGTAHVLDLARAMPALRGVIAVTSDKCYDNRGWAWPYRETDPLGGSDPYSASKACAELVVECYRRSWFADPAGPQLATSRAGNVIGGGDWAADRLVPDIVRAAAAGVPVLLRNPRSIRPWQHVLEPLGGYLLLAERMLAPGAAAFAGAWNFGPGGDPVDVETIARAITRCSPRFDLPVRFAAEGPDLHEAAVLRVDSSKAASLLGWAPRLTSADMLEMTADWYAAFMAGETDMLAFTRAQIDRYVALGTANDDRGLRRCA